MKKIAAICMITVAIPLAACDPERGGLTNSEGGTLVGAVAGGVIGSQFGSGGGRIAATAIGAVVGGIIGSEIGKSMDEADRRAAMAAEYEALEYGQSGVSRPWRNPDSGHYGSVTASKPYRRGESHCRQYSHTIYINGRPETMRGTACRRPDGTWANVG